MIEQQSNIVESIEKEIKDNPANSTIFSLKQRLNAAKTFKESIFLEALRIKLIYSKELICICELEEKWNEIKNFHLSPLVTGHYMYR